jgi:hypothetical protein
MSDKPRATLELLARQQEQILAELANIRADHATLPAILQRLDAALLASQQAQMLDELAKMRADHAALLAIVQRIDAATHGQRPVDVFDPGSDP